jgi:flagellar motor switch protein FliN
MPGEPTLQLFCKMWADNIAVSLASRGVVAPAVVAGEPVSTSAPDDKEFENLVCIRFTCGKAARGELLWAADKSAAKQIANALAGAPTDASPELSDNDRDALAELLRQVAAQTAESWKAEVGSEIEFVYQTTAVPAPVTAQCVTLTLTGQQFPRISLRLFLNGELQEALAAFPAPEPKQQAAAVDSPPAVPEAEPPPPRNEPLPANLGLVLDVALEATIRFGEREMLLRDIFGLMPGAVVELDQMVNEPAELRVAGRLVARGEVVVVDGNFGLRVTEVATLRERVAAAGMNL